VRSKGGGGGGRSFSPPRRTLAIAGVVLLVALGLGLFFAFSSNGSSNSGPTVGGNLQPLSTLGHLASPPQLGPQGPEGIPGEAGPTLAPAASPRPNTSVDGIQCQGGEQTLFHIHARLALFVNGKQEKVPAGVGIYHPQSEPTQRGPFVASGACFSWLHTHASDGIIHIESPVQRTFTLGNFFDVWAQPLSKTQVGPAKGAVTAFLNGKEWTGNPRAIPLGAHQQIQLVVGRPIIGPQKITGWAGL
jgi:hypothetical protein